MACMMPPREGHRRVSVKVEGMANFQVEGIVSVAVVAAYSVAASTSQSAK